MFGLPQPGTVKEILSSDEERFGGKGDGNPKAIRSRKKPFLDMENSVEITLPAMSAVFFRYKPRKQKEEDRKKGRAEKKRK